MSMADPPSDVRTHAGNWSPRFHTRARKSLLVKRRRFKLTCASCRHSYYYDHHYSKLFLTLTERTRRAQRLSSESALKRKGKRLKARALIFGRTGISGRIRADHRKRRRTRRHPSENTGEVPTALKTLDRGKTNKKKHEQAKESTARKISSRGPRE